jgi:hypothetical protein
MNIQDEMQKIHHKFGVSEMANYKIEQFIENLIKEDRAQQLILTDVIFNDRIRSKWKLIKHTMNKFVVKMLELGAELDKAVSPIEISMVINDAEILYRNHIEQLILSGVSQQRKLYRPYV